MWKALECDRFLDLVAIKILKPCLAYQPKRLAQFRREAERGLRLAGPSLLTTYEISSIDGYYFMVMPYVDGISLREVIDCRLARKLGASTGKIHPLVCVGDPEYLRTMTRIIAEATRALARAHEQRIAHRDIKPANILLDDRRSDRVYLCDFGLGRDLEIATIEQMRDGAGTPMYMAPERLLRIPADEIRCDIYSMGVTLFEALTLERPIEIHDDVTFQSLPTFLATAPVRRPSDLRPGFPEELEDVILKAMDRDPARRFESAQEFADALDRLAGRSVSRRKRTAVDRPRFAVENRPHFSEVPAGSHQAHARSDALIVPSPYRLTVGADASDAPCPADGSSHRGRTGCACWRIPRTDRRKWRGRRPNR